MSTIHMHQTTTSTNACGTVGKGVLETAFRNTVRAIEARSAS